MHQDMHKLKAFFAFLYTLFCIGFPLGTFTLVFIVQSYIAYSRRTGWLVQYENIVVCTIIIIFLLYSLALAAWVHGLLVSATKQTRRICYISFAVITTLCLVYWFTPSMHRDNNTPYVMSTDGRFQIGPYPEKQDMIELKKQGYTTIISLLSPYILPFEPVLLKKEISNAKETGIKIINIPMVPWITDNTAAFQKIKAIAQQNNGEKYYVHCYYGRDRGYMFLNIVDPNRAAILQKRAQKNPSARTLTSINLEDNDFGLIVNERLFIAPQLTSEEFIYYIINDKKKNFDAPFSWIIYAKPTDDTPNDYYKSLSGYGIKTSLAIINRFPYDPALLLDIAQKIKNEPGSVLLYSFRTEKGKLTLAQDGILMSYLTNLPSLPRQLFEKSPMANGKTTMIAPNIVVGPQPTKNEIESYLYNVGVRKLMYLGTCKQPSYLFDKTIADQNKLSTDCFSDNDPKGLISQLSQGGPWYVYGPLLDHLNKTLTNTFIHLMPIIPPPKKSAKE
jgi:protein tyrosine phosphatase (PTP) superfamily phosphohydrolase (DUF442 family)